ncbi:Twinfilin A [Scheffersomyces amazonensis]|uniref:Twinfilin A n=1 Tax=Scheffersomyces amazonensis TaxID=1078765 RepID=UPI00315CD2FE
MSTQSGITASAELLEAFKSLQSSANPTPLVVKISSDNTQLIPDSNYSLSTSTTLAERFQSLNDHISKEFPQPSYIVVPNIDTNFIFISFIPDTAPIRQKMLYASTKNTLINALGSNNFGKTNTFSWTELEELSYEHYQSSIASQFTSKESLLSEDEKILNQINSLQDLSLNIQAKPLASINHHNNDGTNKDKLLYNFDDKLNSEFNNLSSNTNNSKLITFNIDSKTEQIKLTSSFENISIDSLISTLESQTSTDLIQPQFSIYNYYHNKFAFIYSCPSGSKVKDRMVYASSKLGLINYLNQILSKDNLSINKSLEVGDLKELELSELEIESEISTPSSINSGSSNFSNPNSNRLKFTKPKGPRRR